MSIDEWVHTRLDRRLVRRRPWGAASVPTASPAEDRAGAGRPGERGAALGFAAAVVLGVADAVTIWAGRLTR
jgi:hypothetical protein